MRHDRHMRKRHSTTALVEPLESRQLLSAAAHSAIAAIARGPGGPPVPPPGSIAPPSVAGQLDPSFGSGGKTTVDFNGLGVQATAVATESDGKTIVVGFASHSPGSSQTDFAVVRFNFNGTLDTTFGPNHNGMVLMPVGDSGSESGAEAVVVDGENRILVAGSDNIVAGASAGVSSDIFVARYLPNGTLDSSFGSHGIADISFGTSNASDAGGIALQNNGKIVVVGQNKDFVDNHFGIGNVNFAIARLNTNGSLDTSFNSKVLISQTGIREIIGGTETIGFSNGDAIANAVTLDYAGTPATNPHYGSIVAAGYVYDGGAFDGGNGVERMAAIRLNPNGSLDNSFNGSGQFEFLPKPFTGGVSTGVAVQSTGNIVLSGTLGTLQDNGQVADNPINNGQFALLRLTPAGHADNTFGNGSGLATLGFAGADYGDSLLLGPNDRLIVGGNAGRLTALVSFTANGQLDNSFGTGGKVTTDFGGATTAADGIAYLGDRIVVAGGGKFDTARYLDTNPNVAVGAFITTASPQSPVTFIVSRSQSLPYDTVVDFSITGTASLNTDYTVNGLSIPRFGVVGQPFPPPSVDIPAGQSYVLVTLTPIDHGTPEPTKTATFNIIPNTFYNVASPSSLTINILGNQAAPTTVGDSADAYVQDGSNANTNFGSATSLVVKSGSTGFNRFTYLKFDLSNVSTINSVQLQLHGNLSNTSDASVVTDVFSVADTSWTESGITFNNAPAAGPTPLASTTITGTSPATYTLDVTAYVKAQKAAGNNIISFVLKNPLASNSAVIFNSREAGMGPSLQIS